jgi:hypothetical protein
VISTTGLGLASLTDVAINAAGSKLAGLAPDAQTNLQDILIFSLYPV